MADVVTTVAMAVATGGVVQLIVPLLRSWFSKNRDQTGTALRIIVRQPDGQTSSLELDRTSISEQDIEALLHVLGDSGERER